MDKTPVRGMRLTSLPERQWLPKPYLHHNAFYNNKTGTYGGITGGVNNVTLSGDPFVSASGGNFAPNSTSGAGALVQAAGWPGAIASSTGYIDIGAVQHQNPAGGVIIPAYPYPMKISILFLLASVTSFGQGNSAYSGIKLINRVRQRLRILPPATTQLFSAGYVFCINERFAFRHRGRLDNPTGQSWIIFAVSSTRTKMEMCV